MPARVSLPLPRFHHAAARFRAESLPACRLKVDGTRLSFSILYACEQLDPDAWQQNFIFRVRHVIADILIEQIIADHAHCNLAQFIPARTLALPVIADFSLE